MIRFGGGTRSSSTRISQAWRNWANPLGTALRRDVSAEDDEIGDTCGIAQPCLVVYRLVAGGKWRIRRPP
jgi:hypothetical protein